MVVPRIEQHDPKADGNRSDGEHGTTVHLKGLSRVLGLPRSARAAGIAYAAVHWYFPTKDELFAAVLERVSAR